MQIDSEALLAAARTQTGLEDFGSETFREGLAVFCESASSEAQLNAVGGLAAPGMILGCLANRLKVTDWVKRHPQVLQEKIEAPLVVVGMFRAGTTFLTYLMEKDPRHRPLLRWEAGDSVPPPTPATLAADPRIGAARMAMAMLDQINPRVRMVQSEEPDGPTECIAVLNQDFKSLVWEALANVPSYGRWLHATDHRSAYAWHRQVLQVLQSGGVRGRWSLKSPHHALHLDALTATYPDARLVLMHRDPTVLCASVCSLITTLTGTFSDADHTALHRRALDRHAGALGGRGGGVSRCQPRYADRGRALRGPGARPDRDPAPGVRRLRRGTRRCRAAGDDRNTCSPPARAASASTATTSRSSAWTPGRLPSASAATWSATTSRWNRPGPEGTARPASGVQAFAGSKKNARTLRSARFFFPCGRA